MDIRQVQEGTWPWAGASGLKLIHKTGAAFKAAALFLLKGYKRFVSPLLPHACRFEPTCSVYMYQAIQKKGLLKGLFLGLKRLARCHPFCEGGIDPVP